MKNSIYFENIEEIGDLQLEHIFYEFEMEPIVFTCSDKNDILYLCLCSEIRNKQKWIISKSSVEILKKLIDEQIDIMTAMRLQTNTYVVELSLSGEEKNYRIESEKMDLLDLPEEGVYLRCDKEDARNYLWSKELLITWKKKNDFIMNSIVDMAVNSYSAAVNASMSIMKNRLEVYADSMNKVFTQRTETFNINYKDKMLLKSEYKIRTNKNNENDLNSGVDEDYSQAA